MQKVIKHLRETLDLGVESSLVPETAERVNLAQEREVQRKTQAVEFWDTFLEQQLAQHRDPSAWKDGGPPAVAPPAILPWMATFPKGKHGKEKPKPVTAAEVRHNSYISAFRHDDHQAYASNAGLSATKQLSMRRMDITLQIH